MSLEKFFQLLQLGYSKEASDLHLKTGRPPLLRINGDLYPLEGLPPITSQEMKTIFEGIVPKRLVPFFTKKGSADFAYQWNNIRLRVNVFLQRGKLSIALRFINSRHLSFEELHLPVEVMKKLALIKSGLVLVVGPTGCGKSTTLAALIEYINLNKNKHIVTIEDPIEFVYEDKKSLIQQREIGQDAESFEIALKHVLRQDPDVILVGEIRDLETVQMAVKAALTGHLVFSTLHTLNVKMTIDRILTYFRPEERESVRMELALALKGVIAQRLVKRKDGQGRVPCVEIMIGNEMVAKLLRENKVSELSQVIKNKVDGMQTYDQSLVDLYKQGLISLEEAIANAEDEQFVKRTAEGRYAEGDKFGLIGTFGR